MKIFHIDPKNEDYTVEDGLTYTTPVYDIYDNGSYTNYTAVYSRYGINLLEDGTWTGMKILEIVDDGGDIGPQ